MTSKTSSPIVQRMTSSPLWTTTHLQPKRISKVSKTLLDMGLSSATRTSTVFDEAPGEEACCASGFLESFEGKLAVLGCGDPADEGGVLLLGETAEPRWPDVC